MTRRIVRAAIHLGIFVIIVALILFVLDNRFRVLPDAIHNHLPAHHAGFVITDITIATCSTLNLLSSCKLDTSEWQRLDKDLYLSTAWVSHAYVHVQRKREEELTDADKVIIDVRISRLDPVASDQEDGPEKWEQRQGGIWLKRTSKKRASDSNKAITAVDVLFGADAVEPRPGWKLTSQPIILSNSGDRPEAHLSIRHGPASKIEKPTLRVRKDGKFKILQVADLHLSTGLGVCRDAEPPTHHGGKCDADPRTLDFVGLVLDSEKPDLVVLSGDQVNGETAPDAQSAMFKYAELFSTRSIPFAILFGNHDDEGNLSREEMMDLSELSLSYSLGTHVPAAVDGVGNYYLEVLSHKHAAHSSALTLYFLDTHAYSPDERNFRGYDWLKKSQIDWFRATSQDLKKSALHTSNSHIRMDMAFIHIPLPEYRNTADIVENSGKAPETPTAPGFNSGFKDALVDEGVLAVSCGHDHVNDYCALSHASEVKDGEPKPELWMCYAGGSGFGGYAGYGDKLGGRGFVRRVRIFEFDTTEGRISTWKRVEWGPNKGDTERRVDELIIVENGKVVAA